MFYDAISHLVNIVVFILSRDLIFFWLQSSRIDPDKRILIIGVAPCTVLMYVLSTIVVHISIRSGVQPL